MSPTEISFVRRSVSIGAFPGMYNQGEWGKNGEANSVLDHDLKGFTVYRGFR